MDGQDDRSENVRAAMAELAASFATHTEMAPILEAVTAHSVNLITECDFADIGPCPHVVDTGFMVTPLLAA